MQSFHSLLLLPKIASRRRQVVYATPQCILVHISCKEERDSVSRISKPLLYLDSHKVLQTHLICYLQRIWENVLGSKGYFGSRGDIRKNKGVERQGWKVQWGNGRTSQKWLIKQKCICNSMPWGGVLSYTNMFWFSITKCNRNIFCVCNRIKFFFFSLIYIQLGFGTMGTSMWEGSLIWFW